jgi:hypothetical protein
VISCSLSPLYFTRSFPTNPALPVCCERLGSTLLHQPVSDTGHWYTRIPFRSCCLIAIPNTVLCGFMPAGTPEIGVVVGRCLLLVGSSAAAQCTRLPELFVFRWQIDHVGYTRECSELWIPLVLFWNYCNLKVGCLHPVACTRSGSGFPSNATLVWIFYLVTATCFGIMTIFKTETCSGY